jgi:16S rRNA (cytosine967-C5)-methyltransferase
VTSPRRAGRPARPRPGRADPARRAAFDVLTAVTERDAYANLLLPTLLAERGIAGRDAALATELTYGTLRGQGSYDAILAVCSDREPDRIDPPLRHVLRLGAHQLLATRVGAHAAVATSVDLAKDVAGPRPAGFVNAVLRRVALRDLEGWLDIAAPGRDGDLIGHLSVRYSHPRWIISALAGALGEDPAAGLPETEAALAADRERPRVTLCAVPGLSTPDELVASGLAKPARWSPFGAYLNQGDPAHVAAVAQGRASVQDEASQLAALALTRADAGADAGEADVWLDLCAGPGGKARVLAGLAAGRGARLLAADLRPHRARLARDAIAGPTSTATSRATSVPPARDAPFLTSAAGPAAAARSAPFVTSAAGPAASARSAPFVTSGAAVAADGTVPAWRQAAFGRVLADVPCSGLGALRRRPEARWRRSPDDIAALGPLQRALLNAALDAARPGGVVAYVTCSPHPAETREVVADVLAQRDDAVVLDAPAVLPEVPALRCPEPHGAFAQFWPHRHGTDAIFLALLRRRA